MKVAQRVNPKNYHKKKNSMSYLYEMMMVPTFTVVIISSCM